MPSAPPLSKCSRKPAITPSWPAKIDDDFQAKLREIGGFRKIAEVEFSVQRNRVLGIYRPVLAAYQLGGRSFSGLPLSIELHQTRTTMKRRQFLTSASAAAAAGSAASTLASPAIAQARVEMNIVSTWPRDFPGFGTSAQRHAARISELSEGRIVTTYYAAGERVGPFDVFDEVASGNSQAYNSADYYWKGKHPAFAYFTSIPFGMTNLEWNAWIANKGGQELWDEVTAPFGIRSIPCGATGSQMGGWFNKEINSADDLKGLKMRMPGLGGDVLSKLGASPVALPPGQIYENLVAGTIDATEWAGPYNDYFMKLYEAAKFYYSPGFHEPGGSLCLGMNKSWWEGLTAIDQQVIIAASNEEHLRTWNDVIANNGEYLDRMIRDHGVELRTFSDDVYDKYYEGWKTVAEETRGHSDLARRVHDAYFSGLQELGRWTAIGEIGYTNQRNRLMGIGR
jgi:TRAP-type mannitol/chloroaromatic compound transport system substrate-binding protein